MPSVGVAKPATNFSKAINLYFPSGLIGQKFIQSYRQPLRRTIHLQQFRDDHTVMHDIDQIGKTYPDQTAIKKMRQ